MTFWFQTPFPDSIANETPYKQSGNHWLHAMMRGYLNSKIHTGLANLHIFYQAMVQQQVGTLAEMMLLIEKPSRMTQRANMVFMWKIYIKNPQFSY